MNREERRRLPALIKSGADLEARAFDRLVSGLAQVAQRGLPLGWDVTLVCTRHKGDGQAQTKMASTLPPEVRDPVLIGLAQSLSEAYTSVVEPVTPGCADDETVAEITDDGA